MLYLLKLNGWWFYYQRVTTLTKNKKTRPERKGKGYSNWLNHQGPLSLNIKPWPRKDGYFWCAHHPRIFSDYSTPFARSPFCLPLPTPFLLDWRHGPPPSLGNSCRKAMIVRNANALGDYSKAFDLVIIVRVICSSYSYWFSSQNGSSRRNHCEIHTAQRNGRTARQPLTVTTAVQKGSTTRNVQAKDSEQIK